LGAVSTEFGSGCITIAWNQFRRRIRGGAADPAFEAGKE